MSTDGQFVKAKFGAIWLYLSYPLGYLSTQTQKDTSNLAAKSWTLESVRSLLFSSFLPVAELSIALASFFC